jgi:uncharacterized protein (DUF58 family)
MLTSRGGATSLLALVLSGGGWALSMPELFAAGVALAAVVVLSLLWVWFPSTKPNVTATAQPNPAHAATTVTVTTTVTGRNARPLLITANISDGRSVRLWTQTGRRHSQTGSFPLPVPTRGRVTIGPFKVIMLDPLGLSRRVLKETSKVEVHVRPRIHPCEAIPLSPSPAFRHHDAQLTATASRTTTGTEPAGLRQYVVGDELRLVHWTASARGRGLMVRTFDDDQSVSAVVLLDDRAEVHSVESFELAVEAAASMISAHSKKGSTVTPDPLLLLWSEVIEHGSGVPLVGGHALDRLVDIELVQVPRPKPDQANEFALFADVVVTGPLDSPTNLREVHPGRVQLIVDPDGVSLKQALRSPTQLEHWTELAR